MKYMSRNIEAYISLTSQLEVGFALFTCLARALIKNAIDTKL